MAFYENLSSEKQDEIYKSLTEKIEAQHTQAYEANLSRAKTESAKKACAGKYEGSWWRLREDWVNGQVSNLHVYDCLKTNQVIGDTQGVIFTQSSKMKKKKS